MKRGKRASAQKSARPEAKTGAAIEPVEAAFDIPTWAAYLAGPVLAVLVFARVLPQIHSYYFASGSADMDLQFRHFIEFAFRTVRDGHIPLWNPHVLCGNAFLPSTCATLFYPVNFLPLLLLPQPLSINVCLLIHVSLLGVFTVYYARVRGLSNLAAMLAAVIACLCSLLPSRVFAGHFTIVCTATWIPLLFALQERLFTRGHIYIVPLAAAAAMAFLGGHLQYAYYCGLLLALNVVFYGMTATARIRWRWMLHQFGWHSLIGLLAFGLAAIEALPVLDVAHNSARGGAKDADWLRFFSMPLENYLTLLTPSLFGTRAGYWGRFYWWEMNFYIGIVGLILLLTALALQARARKMNHVTLLFATSLLLAGIGLIGGLSNAMRLVPGWTLFRGHAKILGLGAIFAAILAAEGFDAMRASASAIAARYARRSAVIVAGALLLALAFCTRGTWTAYLNSPARLQDLMLNYPPNDPQVVSTAVGTARRGLLLSMLFGLATVVLLYMRKRMGARTLALAIIAIAAIDLGIFAIPVYTQTFASKEQPYFPRELQTFLAGQQGKARGDIPMIGLGNAAIPVGMETISGRDINVSKYWDTFVCAYNAEPKGMPHLHFEITHEGPLLDCTNLKYAGMLEKTAAQFEGKLPKIAQFGEITLFDRPTALPRAYVVGKERWIDEDENEIIKAMNSGINFRREVLLTGATVPTVTEEFDAVPVELKYSHNRIDATAPRKGWLVICDSFYPHWRARVNDLPARVVRANASFRAVRVNQGDKLVMRYENGFFTAGAIASAVSVVVGATLFFVLWRRERKTTRRERKTTLGVHPAGTLT